MITPSYAQTPEGHAPSEGAHVVEGTEAHGGEHGGFPPFDPATYGSQLFWLAITFGILYYLMSRIALPRIATILEERNDRIADDLAEAEKLKRETDAAIAAYEQALAEARAKAHGIAQGARDKSKAEIDRQRTAIEADLGSRMDEAEKRIGEVKASALADVDAIAREATAAMVETLIGSGVSEAEVAQAVGASASRGADR